MTTFYTAWIPEEVLAQDPIWPPGFRLLETGRYSFLHLGRPTLVEDDDAPPELAGRWVLPSFTIDAATHRVTITGRTLL
jgi:hypothetical protein